MLKCKVFKIGLDETAAADEAAMNAFLAEIAAPQIFASVVGGATPYWSVLVFYETEPTAKSKPAAAPPSEFTAAPEIVIPHAVAGDSADTILNQAEEAVFDILKRWRNQRAAQDNFPPYMVASNDSLRRMIKLPVRTRDDFLQIKGFGEKRTEKYADEILEILADKH